MRRDSSRRSWRGPLPETDRRDHDRTPSIPGHELAGVVTALGYGTTGVSVGQRVLGTDGLASRRHPGGVRGGRGTQPCAAAGRRRLHRGHEPADLGTDHVAGTVRPRAAFGPGRASSRTARPAQSGRWVTQLAREAGAYVISTGHAADRETALDLGRRQEFVDLDNDTLEDVGGVDLVFDVIGGDILKRSANLVRAGGTLVTVVGPPEVGAGRRPRNRLRRRRADRAQLSEIVQRVQRRTATNEHRHRRNPRRRRRRLQFHRADQGQDHHQRSAMRAR